MVAKLAFDEQQTLADTAAGLDTVQLGAAVAAASTARRIDIYGVGASSSSPRTWGRSCSGSA